MTKRIFRSIFFAAFCVLLASLAIITGCLYEYYSNAFENQMRDELNLAAAAVDMSGSGYDDMIARHTDCRMITHFCLCLDRY